jgi:YD repeat-containing protein
MSTEFPGECRHFLSYSGVKLPLNLMTPLEPEQIANRNTYFRGYFDERGRLIGIQKIVYAETEFEHRYEYDDSGVLLRAEITDVEGEVTVMHFGQGGKVD